MKTRLLSIIMAAAIVFGAVPFTATTAFASGAASIEAPGAIPSIRCDEEVVITADGDSGEALFEFIPDEDGVYVFYSFNNDIDTYGYILDSDFEILAEDDDGGEDRNFRVQYKMVAGTRYILKARPYSDSEIGTYSVKITKLVPAGSISTISVNDRKTVHITEGGKSEYYKFIPEEDSYYAFYSISDSDTYGYILDEGLRVLESDDDSGEDLNFRIKCYLEAGQTYYLQASYLSDDRTGTFEVCVEKTLFITNLEIESLPYKLDYIRGLVWNYVNYDGLVLKATWSDGTTTLWRAEYDDYYIGDERIYFYGDSVDEDGIIIISCDGVEVQYQIDLTDNPVERIEIVNPSVIKPLIENVGGYWEEDGNGTSYFCYYMPDMSDVLVRIYYTDGTSKTVSYYDGADGYRFESSSNQYNNHWTLGSDNYIEITYLGKTAYLPVTIVESPVERIEIVNPSVIKPLVENTNGYWEEDEWGTSYFYYYRPNMYNVLVRIYYTDGTDITVSFYAGADGYEFGWNSNQNNKHWTLGSDNYAEISFMGKSAYLPITIIEDPIERIEVVNPSVIKPLMENTNGYWSENSYGTSYFYYNIPDLYNVLMCIYYTDGTSETVPFSQNVNGYEFDCFSNQHDKHWTLGSDNYLEITFMGKSTFLQITIVENPVERIEIVNPQDVKPLIENVNGYWSEDDRGTPFFCYYLPDMSDVLVRIYYTDGTNITVPFYEGVNGDGFGWSHDQTYNHWTPGSDNYAEITFFGRRVSLQITVVENPVERIEVVNPSVVKPLIENSNGYWSVDSLGASYFFYYMPNMSDVLMCVYYTDGTNITVPFYEGVNGYGFGWSNDQYINHWTIGSDNYININYFGKTTQLPVTVIESPVDRIEINTAPTREYVYGDTEYGWISDEGYYYFYPNDLTGLVFTVYYKDGSSKTYTSEDIDGVYIDGYSFGLTYDESNPEVGMFPVTFTYMGKSAEYKVLLKASAVASIAVTKQPTRTEYTKGYLPDFIGMEITITYTDGSRKAVTLTDENLKYGYMDRSGLFYRVDIDGHTLTIEPYYGDNMYYVASYLDVSCEIHSITFTESKKIASVELDNVSWNGDGMIAGITYADGTHETVTLKLAVSYQYSSSIVWSVGKTENGLLPYYIETYTNAAGNVVMYEISILDQIIVVEPEPAIIGDINGDGVVNSKDSNMLKRMLVGNIKATRAADLDGDGKVTSKDAFKLKKLLVQ